MRQGNSRGDVPGDSTVADVIVGQTKAIRTTNQSVATGTTLVNIALNGTEEYDTDSLHDLVTDNQRIIGISPNKLGVFNIFIQYAANVTGDRVAEFTLGGSASQRGVRATPATASNKTKLTALTIGGPGGSPAAGCDAQTFQTSGGALNLELASLSWGRMHFANTAFGFANSRNDVTGLSVGSNPIVAKAISTSVQSINSGAYTPVTFTGVAFDTSGTMWSAANPSRLTIPSDGYYLLIFNGTFALNTVGDRGIDFAINGSRISEGELTQAVAVGAILHPLSASCSKQLTAGQYVEAHVFHSKGSALNLGVAGEPYTELMIYKYK